MGKMSVKEIMNNVGSNLKVFFEKFQLDPLTRKRLSRFGEVKRAKISLYVLLVSLFFALFAELFISNRALLMYVDGKLYFPTYSKMLFAKDFGFQHENELELNYREFKKHLSETGRGWLIMPFVPYNAFETAKPEGVLSTTYVGSPILGVSVNKQDSSATDEAKDYTWIDLSSLGGVKMPDGSYVWIKYGKKDGKNKSISDFPGSSRPYIGIAVNKKSKNESSNPKDYNWHKISSGSSFKQEDGKYIWFKYAKGKSGEMYHPLPPSFNNRHIF